MAQADRRQMTMTAMASLNPCCPTINGRRGRPRLPSVALLLR